MVGLSVRTGRQLETSACFIESYDTFFLVACINMATTEEIELVSVAERAIGKLSDGHFTLQAFMPVVTMLVEHADDMIHLTGPQKKQLVLSVLCTVARRLPPPEGTVACMLVQQLGPAAVDALVSVSRQAEVKLGTTRLMQKKPQLSWPKFPIRIVWTRPAKPPSAVMRRCLPAHAQRVSFARL